MNVKSINKIKKIQKDVRTMYQDLNNQIKENETLAQMLESSYNEIAELIQKIEDTCVEETKLETKLESVTKLQEDFQEAPSKALTEEIILEGLMASQEINDEEKCFLLEIAYQEAFEQSRSFNNKSELWLYKCED
eukprot:CAMPEP_0168328152 /NCGR_PEP_ID=MMETSP0213-20121227/6315_1 /TAXON_ID=151035 /ORGANISM="Euplotes harpa, Strain FSP1.4" /LENGTH=134 /DNA_ID=CAMNT_0008331177 /DNA_START=526 /DNA_END=930 /DNA_ORIENTATION=+